MKKYIVFSIIMISLVGILIYLNLPKKGLDEILVVPESHYILYEQDKTISMKYFSTKKDILDERMILSTFIYNADETIKFQIEAVYIDTYHNEQYQDKTYYGYELILTLPEIDATYLMDKLYIKINYNHDIYEFFAGTLYVEYPEQQANYIHWYGIEGIKDDLPRLFQIIVDVSLRTEIDSIYVGPDETPFHLGLDNIIIQVLSNDYLFNTTFVKIITSEGITYLPNFSYFVNYELLSARLHHNYVIY